MHLMSLSAWNYTCNPTSLVLSDDKVTVLAAMHGNPDQLLLLDDQTMEQVDRFELDGLEAVCSLCTVTFTDDATEYFAIGTAYVLPEEPEPTKVWLSALSESRV